MTAMMRRARCGVLVVALGATACGLPMVGQVKNRFFVAGVDIDDPVIGKSRAMPTVLKITVDDEPGAPGNVGQLVKNTFFADDPPFVFNVAFSCGDAGFCDGHPVYAYPESIWFNVFFGYYEIVVPRSRWQRPFGYRFVDGKAEVEFRDIIRIGKADWNYFSNYMYGVPREAVTPYDAIDYDSVGQRHLGRVKVGHSEWDVIALDNVEVVSGYVSGEDGKHLQRNDPLLTKAWQAVFGPPRPSPRYPQSFIPTHMRATIYLAYREVYSRELGESAFATLIFGATINDDYADKAENERFLGLQVEAMRRVIRHSYAFAGFRPPLLPPWPLPPEVEGAVGDEGAPGQL